MSEKIKRIYRSRQNRIILGICGGIGQYFKIDPTLIRILFVLFVFAGGSAILLYIILAFIMPLTPQGQGILIKEPKIKELVSELKQSVCNLALETNKKKMMVSQQNKETTELLIEERKIIGISLIIFGLINILNEFFPSQRFFWRLIWPVTIILIGFFLIQRQKSLNN